MLKYVIHIINNFPLLLIIAQTERSKKALMTLGVRQTNVLEFCKRNVGTQERD